MGSLLALEPGNLESRRQSSCGHECSDGRCAVRKDIREDLITASASSRSKFPLRERREEIPTYREFIRRSPVELSSGFEAAFLTVDGCGSPLRLEGNLRSSRIS